MATAPEDNAWPLGKTLKAYSRPWLSRVPSDFAFRVQRRPQNGRALGWDVTGATGRMRRPPIHLKGDRYGTYL